MISVGVDVPRLGLMVVASQPKTTAENIQATSRIGRKFPGLVVTVYYWARPRDLSHYERFEHYHATFYQHVEALSVTPFSPTALDRGIDGLLVSAARVLQAVEEDGLSPERNAGKIRQKRSAVEALANRLKVRIAAAAQDDSATARATNLMVNKIDRWTERENHASAQNKTLVYERTGEGDVYLPLIVSPENFRSSAGGNVEAPFVVANSMREVQPEINILVSPVKDRRFMIPPEGAPTWTLPAAEEDGA
jgi:hypothetical protein